MTARRSILVTGGAGYIGSHCCKALSVAGYNPVCFDNFSTDLATIVRSAWSWHCNAHPAIGPAML
jgi:UDP-glucose 4-epimerase